MLFFYLYGIYSLIDVEIEEINITGVYEND